MAEPTEEQRRRVTQYIQERVSGNNGTMPAPPQREPSQLVADIQSTIQPYRGPDDPEYLNAAAASAERGRQANQYQGALDPALGHWNYQDPINQPGQSGPISLEQLMQMFGGSAGGGGGGGAVPIPTLQGLPEAPNLQAILANYNLGNTPPSLSDIENLLFPDRPQLSPEEQRAADMGIAEDRVGLAYDRPMSEIERLMAGIGEGRDSDIAVQENFLEDVLPLLEEVFGRGRERGQEYVGNIGDIYSELEQNVGNTYEQGQERLRGGLNDSVGRLLQEADRLGLGDALQETLPKTINEGFEQQQFLNNTANETMSRIQTLGADMKALAERDFFIQGVDYDQRTSGLIAGVQDTIGEIQRTAAEALRAGREDLAALMEERGRALNVEFQNVVEARTAEERQYAMDQLQERQAVLQSDLALYNLQVQRAQLDYGAAIDQYGLEAQRINTDNQNALSRAQLAQQNASRAASSAGRSGLSGIISQLGDLADLQSLTGGNVDLGPLGSLLAPSGDEPNLPGGYGDLVSLVARSGIPQPQAVNVVADLFTTRDRILNQNLQAVRASQYDPDVGRVDEMTDYEALIQAIPVLDIGIGDYGIRNDAQLTALLAELNRLPGVSR